MSLEASQLSSQSSGHVAADQSQSGGWLVACLGLRLIKPLFHVSHPPQLTDGRGLMGQKPPSYETTRFRCGRGSLLKPVGAIRSLHVRNMIAHPSRYAPGTRKTREMSPGHLIAQHLRSVTRSDFAPRVPFQRGTVGFGSSGADQNSPLYPALGLPQWSTCALEVPPGFIQSVRFSVAHQVVPGTRAQFGNLYCTTLMMLFCGKDSTGTC